MIDYINVPKFIETHFGEIMEIITPIEEYDGYLCKRDDLFNLSGVCGGKVRQCLKLVYDNLDYIKTECNGGLITAAGLPSPQSVIVSVVARYFGLKSIVTVPKYKDGFVDFNRINVSLAQKFGSKIYGVGNPNPAGPEKDATELQKETGYYRVKFGMNGENVTKTIAKQCENLPNELENIVCIAGSGLSVIGILRGIKQFNKKVNNVYVITLSGYMESNKKKWYDILPDEQKYDGKIHIIRSEITYQKYLNEKIGGLDIDCTYESKAYVWMKDNIIPSKDTLFWIVGRKCYDLSYIEQINWNTSDHEKQLDTKRSIKDGFKMNNWW